MDRKSLYARMQQYSSAWACYAEAHHNGTINDETLIGICEDFLAMPEADRVQADRDIYAARRDDGKIAPEPFEDLPGLKKWNDYAIKEAAKEMMERKMTEAGIVRLTHDVLPKGLDSEIALRGHHEAEMARIQKEISAQYSKMLYEPKEDEYIYVKCDRCGYTSRRPEEATQCPQCRFIHGKGRLPALPDVTQYKAAPDTRYWRLQDPARDTVVVLAQSSTGLRMVQVDGRVWHLLSGRTNAPQGEIAITDDDLETLLQYEKTTKTYGPRIHTGKLQDKLTRQLFFTDPEIRDYVGKQMDVPETFQHGTNAHKRFAEGMEKAWSRAMDLHAPEREWMRRCHTRACAMMNHDPDLR